MKKSELFDLIENKLKGIIIRSKAEYVVSNEKNSKLFSNLEKKEI